MAEIIYRIVCLTTYHGWVAAEPSVSDHLTKLHKLGIIDKSKIAEWVNRDFSDAHYIDEGDEEAYNAMCEQAANLSEKYPFTVGILTQGEYENFGVPIGTYVNGEEYKWAPKVEILDGDNAHVR